MKIIRSLESLNSLDNIVMAIGNFDGVHLGHTHLLQTTKAFAHQHHLPFVILTFFPHPHQVLRPPKPFLIQSLCTRLRTIEKFIAPDFCYIAHFTATFATLSATQFTHLYLNKVTHLFVGHDWCFGKNRQGNIDFLHNNTPIQLHSPEPFTVDNTLCTSTLLRTILCTEGLSENFYKFSSTPYEIEGHVTKGTGKATSILNIPTANIPIPPEILTPPYGVYTADVLLGEEQKKRQGIINIGVRPTFEKQSKPYCEIHIFDFNQSLYGKKIRIFPKAFIRKEQTFESLEMLKQQIQQDILHARYLNNSDLHAANIN